LKKHLKNLKRLRAGTYRDPSEGLFLDRNERVSPLDPETINSLTQRLAKIKFNLYPELLPFYKKLSEWLDIPEDCIFVTEGISGAIKALIETITYPGNNIVCPSPTFAMYPVYSAMFQLEHRTVGYTEEYTLDVKSMLEQIDDQTSIVFLPNPNVPISGTLDVDEIATIASHCKKHNAVLAVDEVYYPFGGPTAIELIGDHKNLFIMRSFSKAFGLAGIRVGYLLGNNEQINYVSKTRPGYEINSLSIEIVSFFIERFYLVEEYIQQVKDGFVYLKNELTKMGLDYNGGNEGNFLYVDFKEKQISLQLLNRLRDKKIYIRGGWPRPYDTGLSISGAPKNVMEKFFKEFSKIYWNLSGK